jgi:dsDNA-specific endonuclease/ATPase MutS2
VKLGQSGTGATVYVEPVELLELNNREAALADQEMQAELAVLQVTKGVGMSRLRHWLHVDLWGYMYVGL